MSSIERPEGLTRLINAAKYLDKRWKSTPIRSADINDKLACDKLLWLVHNFDFEELEVEGQYEVFEIPKGSAV